MDERKEVVKRIWVLVVAMLILLLVYLLRLISIQLINGEDFLAQATQRKEYDFVVTAARGEIVDAQGRRLVSNVNQYDLVMNNLLLGEHDLNESLKEVCQILQANDEEWFDELLISEPDENGNYTFLSEGEEWQEESLARVKAELDLQQYATANNVMQTIVERYDLQEYSAQWQRILGGIRYEMEQIEFSDRNNYTFVENVSDKTVAMIKERSLTLFGPDIVETSVRSYLDGTLMPHALGRVSKITAEQWYVEDEDGNITKPLQEAGYAMNDMIGISGLESAFEEELRGEDGVMTVIKDEEDVIIDSFISEEPEPGLTVMTTINSDLQKAANQSLESTILNLQQTGTLGNGAEANAGAVVVVDVKTGGVLAAANYPSYDQNLYSTQYSTYVQDPGAPLFNRAMMGQYTPGSIFKPVVGLAGILSGTSAIDEIIPCSGRYIYYEGYSPGCVQYNHSGNMSLQSALQWSCNIYFYDVGRRSTSEVYGAMAKDLGLTVQTGVEIPESSGHMTSTEDANYTPSLEVQAAIGQGNTTVTPLQMAAYAATIANDGLRYETHYLKALIDTNTGEIVEEYQPKVVSQVEDNVGAFAVVEEGMVAAANTMAPFANYPYTIAAKTGSPQRSETYTTSTGASKYYTNTMLVAYAPVEDPQIAVGVVIEYGASGSKAAALVAEIFDAYFFGGTGSSVPVVEQELLA